MSEALVKQQPKGIRPTTFTEVIEFANQIAKSQLVPDKYRNKPGDIVVAIQMGSEIGLAPLQSLQNIAVINGKPSIYGDAAMALALAHPACEWIKENSFEDIKKTGIATCTVKRKGCEPQTSTFSVEDAKRAGLWGKRGPWSQYPERMQQMRARGFGLRNSMADALAGLITAEEAADYPEQAGSFTKREASPQEVKKALPPKTPSEVVEAKFTPNEQTTLIGEMVAELLAELNKAQDHVELGDAVKNVTKSKAQYGFTEPQLAMLRDAARAKTRELTSALIPDEEPPATPENIGPPPMTDAEQAEWGFGGPNAGNPEEGNAM